MNCRQLRDESRKHIAALQSRYVDETGIASLKIRHNNVLGYFIDVTTAQAEKMPTGEDSPFIHRQTLASAMRFTTVELGELEGKLAQAGERALAMELELFDDLVRETVARAEADFPRGGRAGAARCLGGAGGSWRPTVATCARALMTVPPFRFPAGVTPWSRPRLQPHATAGLVANDCDLAEDPPAVAGHRSEHGG